MDKYGYMTIQDFYTTFAEELKTMEDNGLHLTKYKNDGVWNRLYFTYDADQTKNEYVQYAIIFISPLGKNESWTVSFEAINCSYKAGPLMAIAKFVDSLNKHPFKSLVRSVRYVSREIQAV